MPNLTKKSGFSPVQDVALTFCSYASSRVRFYFILTEFKWHQQSNQEACFSRDTTILFLGGKVHAHSLILRAAFPYLLSIPGEFSMLHFPQASDTEIYVMLLFAYGNALLVNVMLYWQDSIQY